MWFLSTNQILDFFLASGKPKPLDARGIYVLELVKSIETSWLWFLTKYFTSWYCTQFILFCAVFAQVTLEFEDDLQPGICELRMDYSGEMGKDRGEWVRRLCEILPMRAKRESVGPTTVGGLSFQKQFGGVIEELLPGNTWMNQMHSDALDKNTQSVKACQNRNDVWETSASKSRTWQGCTAAATWKLQDKVLWREAEALGSRTGGGINYIDMICVVSISESSSHQVPSHVTWPKISVSKESQFLQSSLDESVKICCLRIQGPARMENLGLDAVRSRGCTEDAPMLGWTQPESRVRPVAQRWRWEGRLKGYHGEGY